MMEPHSCNARFDVYDRLVLYSSTQTPVHVRRILSQALQIPISRIRVIKPRVGGGFGGKQAIHGEVLLAAVAMRTKKPCKLVYTRKEVFESSYSRHPMRMTLRLGAMKDGTLKAIDCQVLSDTGAYGEHALTVFMVTAPRFCPFTIRWNRSVSVGTSSTPIIRLPERFAGTGQSKATLLWNPPSIFFAKLCRWIPSPFG
jgi:CO/xanthine dehydrogenase Mo-binding subunit